MVPAGRRGVKPWRREAREARFARRLEHAPFFPFPLASSADTSTGNIAFNNVLLGGAGATSTVSGADLSTSKNITTATAGLFVNSGSGNYTLAAGGPGIGTGIMTFGGAQAPSAGNGTYDIGAFSFASP